MTKECIEEFRKIVIPFVRKRLLEIDYEKLGKSDAEEFTRDFNEILNLAIKALEQEPTDKHFTKADIDAIVKAINAGWELRVNEILDKIRAEIAEYGSIMVAYAITKETKTDKGIEKLVSGVLKQAKEQVLDIIDKYKAEPEADNGDN